MNIIETEEQYNQVLRRIDDIWDNTDNYDELDRLCALVEEYEAKHYNMGDPTMSYDYLLYLERSLDTIEKQDAFIEASFEDYKRHLSLTYLISELEFINKIRNTHARAKDGTD
jgi:hypothetical protein